MAHSVILFPSEAHTPSDILESNSANSGISEVFGEVLSNPYAGG